MNKRSNLSRIIALLLVAAVTISVIVVPADVSAASKKKRKKPKVTCSISFKNINSNTVIKKGKKLKVAYSAKSSNGKKVKVRFRSSNRRIATVSRNGVIKAKRNGTVKITATGYVKGRKRGKKTVKIKVGKPVTGIRLSGYTYLRAGRSTKLKSVITPSNATNKKVVWSSSNTRAVKVDHNGKIIGVGNGSAVITARAADGAGASRTVTVYSHRYTKNDTHWIAHRGLHETAKENTAAAFRLAGQAGFWGCECDIWETKHVQKEIPVQTQTITINDSDGVVTDSEVAETVDVQATTITEDFDIVVSHDNSLKRVFGVDINVENTTSEQIRANSKLSQVCFFDEYLKICRQYGMVPIVEIKDYNMTDEGIARFVDMVNEQGLLEQAQFISFGSSVLERTKKYINDSYGIEPYTGYLIGWGDVSAAVKHAHEKGFTGINISYNLLTPQVNRQSKDYGLKTCVWTYNGYMLCDEMLFKHIISGQYDVYSATTDGKFF